jgi:hypothetical protein
MRLGCSDLKCINNLVQWNLLCGNTSIYGSAVSSFQSNARTFIIAHKVEFLFTLRQSSLSLCIASVLIDHLNAYFD